MVNRSNRCSVLTGSRTSSCTDFVCNCCPRRCIDTCYRDQFELINDRTYTALRKICHKIIKDYNRAQCREKYTIFDGGNSINVRIHRSGSRGDENNNDQRYDKSNANRYPLQDSRGDKYTKKNAGRDLEKFNVDVNISNREKTMRGKSKEAGEEVKDNYERRNQKWKGAKPRDVELNGYDENDYDTKLKGKGKFGKKGNRNDDLDINEQRAENLGTKKKGESSGINKKDFRDGSDSDENDNDKERFRSHKNDGKKSRQLKKGEPNSKNRELITAEKDNMKSRKGKTKYMEYKDHADNGSDDEYAQKGKYRKTMNKYRENKDDKDIVSDDEYDQKGKYGKRKNKYREHKDDRVIVSDDEYDQKGKYGKGKKAKDNNNKFANTTGSSRKLKSYNTNDETRASKNFRQNIYRKSQDFDDISKGRNGRVITNLRSKVRRGDNVGLNNESSLNHIRNLQKVMIQKAQSLQYRRTKSSRADEVRDCDYLRALMEQRDLCQLCCTQQSNQCGPHICIPRTCIPRCCANTLISYCPKTCEC